MKVNAAASHMPSRSPHLIISLTFFFPLHVSVFIHPSRLHFLPLLHKRGQKKPFYPLVSLVVGPNARWV
jgi:hypothetical protein